MMKAIYTGLLFLSLSAGAQDNLQAETENGKPYLVHTVTSGETLSSLSRAYKISVADIAAFNKINADKGLKKDQELRIPLQTANLSQTECTTCARVYYKVQPREGLYRIGLNFGNIKAETLKRINNLPGESVDIGQSLLVGYLTAPAGKIPENTARQNPPQQNTLVKTEPATQPKKQEPKPQETQPVVVKVDPPKEQPKQNTEPKQTSVPVQNGKMEDGTGVFASEYEGKMNVSRSGTAAIFKSSSGWGDTKYYVLMNNTNPGTIIKVDNPATGKSIYAKVLGELPQIRQNENVLLRISDAAATVLGGTETSINVTIKY